MDSCSSFIGPLAAWSSYVLYPWWFYPHSFGDSDHRYTSEGHSGTKGIVMVKNDEADYKQYIVQRASNTYWSMEEKVQMVLIGLSKQIPITTLCRVNNLIPNLYYEWKDLFISGGKEAIFGKDSRSQREINCEKKVDALERFIGELVLEKELLKKNKNK